jgi:hypothetical protein
MTDALGWVATTLFAASYFTRTPAQLRGVQALAAVLWIVYGLSIRAWPVVIANAIIAVLAIGSRSARTPEIK